MKPYPIGYATMSSALPEAVHYHRWISDLVSPWIGNDNLLEIGPGYGQYTSHFASKVRHLLAVDIEPECVKHIQSAYGNHVTAIVTDFGKGALDTRLIGTSWESILCLNVLEHIENDIQALMQIRQLLSPFGKAVFLVPAHPSLYGSMDELAGHYRRYTLQNLLKKLTHANLACLHATYINPIGGLGWWWNAKIAKPGHLSEPWINCQIRFFDRLGVPLSKVATRLTQKIFGQSLLMVAKRIEKT